jgi:hypothetical protein
MTAAPAGGPLSNDEYRTLAKLLARFASHHLDQWDHWRIDTQYGSVYVDLSVKLREGYDESGYATIWPLPKHLLPDDESS